MAGDVQFLMDVVREVKQLAQIDPSRVFAVGFSSGAGMCHTLINHASGLLAGVVPLSATMGARQAQGFSPKYPISIFTVMGDQDRMFAGGSVAGIAFELVSFDETVARYVELNQIQEEPDRKTLPGDTEKNGLKVIATSYPPGKDGCTVEAWVVQGGGHALELTNLGDVIWEFLQRCPPRKLAVDVGPASKEDVR